MSQRVSVKELPDFLVKSIKDHQKFSRKEISVEIRDSAIVGANLHAPQFDNFDYSYYIVVDLKSRSVDYPQKGLKQPMPGGNFNLSEKKVTLGDDEFLVYGDKHSNYASLTCNSDTFNKYFSDLKTVTKMLKGAALELIRLTKKKGASEGLTPADANKLKHFFEAEAKSPSIKALVTEDRGTCVLGNGISVIIGSGRKEKEVPVFRNCWTQAEQSKAIQAMIEKAEKKFPEYAGKIIYNWGVMD